MAVVNSSPRRTSGFTLVELLVVIAIIGVLVALLLPAVQAAREAARRSTCLNQIRQVGLACLNYDSANTHFPPAADTLNPSANTSRREYSWIAFLLPYLEQQGLFDSIDDTVDWFHENNELPATTPIPVLTCPSRGELAPVNMTGPGNDEGIGFGIFENSNLNSHYLAVLGANTELSNDIPSFCSDPANLPYSMETIESGSTRRTVEECVTGNHGPIANNGIIFRHSRTTMGKVVDGASNTFLAGEVAFGLPEAQETRGWIVGYVGNFMYGAKNLAFPVNSGARPGPRRNNMGFGSQHPGGCHFVMADGSARFLSENIELKVLFDLAARNDGYTIDSSAL